MPTHSSKTRAQSQAQAAQQQQLEQQREIAASVLAEQNPPPSLLDAIMDKVLAGNNSNNQQDHSQNQFDPNDPYGQQQQQNDPYYQHQQQQHQQGPPEPVRHPERPVLSQVVLCGNIAHHADAATVRAFFEEASTIATSHANEHDPLNGRMVANADALGLANEVMKVVGVFVELPKHFWVVLEAEPPHLHEALREIFSRIKKGKALEKIRQQQAHLQQQAQGGGGGGASGSQTTQSKSHQQQQQLQQQQLLQHLQQQGAFDGVTQVHVAFYADDVIERMAQNWSSIDLTEAPPSQAHYSTAPSHLDEYVVESIHSIGELAASSSSSHQQTTGGGLGGAGGMRGLGSALADTARLAKMANLVLPNDEMTDKMKEVGLFFGLEEFVREFCTESTGVPKLYSDLVHPIEPALEY